MMDLWRFQHDTQNVFRPREVLTHRTFDIILSLKDRWASLGPEDRRVLQAVAGALPCGPREVVLEQDPHLSMEGARKRVYRTFERFKLGLIDCEQSDFHLLYEAMFSID